MRCAWCLVCCVVMLLPVLVAGAEAVRVNKAKAAIARKTFDPAKPPVEMPRRSAKQRGVTAFKFGLAMSGSFVAGAVQAEDGKTRAEMTLNSLSLNPDLSITIWLPTDASEALRTHEEAHRRLCEIFYRDADTVAAKIGRSFVGRTFTGEGKTAAVARKAAENAATQEIGRAYLHAVQAPALATNDIFDEITRHGQNGDISVDDAMEEALKRQRESRN